MNRRISVVLVLATIWSLCLIVETFADVEASAPIFSEYHVFASPLNVAVQSPRQIWFTLPNHNALGKLVVTSTLEYQVVTYTVPTVAGEPYDLKLVSGKVWFTERAGNKIGRFDLDTEIFDEFVIPTVSSRPTGIDVLATNPVQVWFTESSGNKLGRLVVTSTVDYVFTEYSLPSGYPNAQPEDIVVESGNSIWFTAPGVSRLGNFSPSLWPNSSAFEMISTGASSQPWSVKVDASGYPWITERVGNRIGMFFPQTISFFNWYPLPAPNSDPYGLEFSQGYVWFTERNGNRLGQLDRLSRRIREFGLPTASLPTGVAADANGCLWIALSGRNKIASWCPPYFHSTYLPILMRGQ